MRKSKLREITKKEVAVLGKMGVKVSEELLCFYTSWVYKSGKMEERSDGSEERYFVTTGEWDEGGTEALHSDEPCVWYVEDEKNGEDIYWMS